VIPEVEKLRRANPRLFQHKNSRKVANLVAEHYEQKIERLEAQINFWQEESLKYKLGSIEARKGLEEVQESLTR
jgi:hypothetical protein